MCAVALHCIVRQQLSLYACQQVAQVGTCMHVASTCALLQADPKLLYCTQQPESCHAMQLYWYFI